MVVLGTLTRGFVLAAVLLCGSSCSSPAYRDFAEVATAPAADPVAAVSALIDVSGDVPADLAPYLAAIGKNADIPAMAAAVLHGNRVVARGVTGVRRRGYDTPVAPDDQFHIASCAKAMSATLIARLVETGKLEWDRPVSYYFPGEPLHPNWDAITLRHLLTHTAGLRDPLGAFLTSTYFDGGTLMERRAKFVQKVLRSKPHSAAGGEVVYCNADYIVAAAVAEKVTGESWEQMMSTRVFVPLGLESAGFGPPGIPGQLVQPWGHGKFRVLQIGVVGNTAFDPGSRSADYPAIASPAGYIHLSIDDWARFVALHLRGHSANPHRHVAVLRHQTLDTLHDLRPGVTHAGGWFVGTRPWAQGSRPEDTGRVLFHLGDNGRWTSAVWMAPEIDLAVLVTCNRGDMSRSVDEAVGQLVRTYSRR